MKKLLFALAMIMCAQSASAALEPINDLQTKKNYVRIVNQKYASQLKAVDKHDRKNVCARDGKLGHSAPENFFSEEVAKDLDVQVDSSSAQPLIVISRNISWAEPYDYVTTYRLEVSTSSDFESISKLQFSEKTVKIEQQPCTNLRNPKCDDKSVTLSASSVSCQF